MRQYDLLWVLLGLRLSGDERYFRYVEVFRLVRKEGRAGSYFGVWRQVNALYTAGLLEMKLLEHGAQRTAVFRARTPATDRGRP